MADKLIGGLTPTAAVVLTDKVPKEPTAGPPAEYFLVSQLVTLLNTIYAPITGGAYVLKAGDTMTGLLTIAQATANTSNLILSGQSLTGANAQSLLDMAGTWNTSGAPTALKLNMVNTASGAGSLLADFQIGGVSRVSISKQGTIKSTIATIADSGFVVNGIINANLIEFQVAGVYKWAEYVDGSFNLNFFDASGIRFGIMQGADAVFIGPGTDCRLYRDAADVLAIRRTITAQTFRWYRTFTDTSNYERGALQTAAGQIILAAETAGTGADDIDLVLTPAGVGRVNITTAASIDAAVVSTHTARVKFNGTEYKVLLATP